MEIFLKIWSSYLEERQADRSLFVNYKDSENNNSLVSKTNHKSEVKANQECYAFSESVMEAFSESVMEGNKPMRNNPLLYIGEPWMGGSENREAGPTLVGWDEHN